MARAWIEFCDITNGSYCHRSLSPPFSGAVCPFGISRIVVVISHHSFSYPSIHILRFNKLIDYFNDYASKQQRKHLIFTLRFITLKRHHHHLIFICHIIWPLNSSHTHTHPISQHLYSLQSGLLQHLSPLACTVEPITPFSPVCCCACCFILSF